MKEIIIKKDGIFKLKYIPVKKGSIIYSGPGYVDSETGEPFEGTVDIIKTKYDKNNNRLEEVISIKSKNIIFAGDR